MSTPNVHLAFQGGGAKLAVMLPVADAFSTAQKNGRINIAKLAGTSAGSICAALVATEADFEEVRKYIVANGTSLLSKLVPAEAAALATRLRSQKKFGWRDAVTHRKFLWNTLYHGQPILNHEELNSFVKGLLRAGTGSDLHYIENCNSELTIISSNIVDSIGVAQKNGDLRSAIIDSCSLPVILRSFSSLSGTHHVDGGLCDNLPVEGLMSDPTAPVFAVFPRQVRDIVKIDNIAKYIVSLLSASINHNVTRSMAMVPKPMRFEVETDLSLLDFDAAVQKLSDVNWYNAEKSRALARLENFSKSFGVTTSPHQARVIGNVSVQEYESCLASITNTFVESFDVLKARFLVRVNSDVRYQSTNEILNRPADTVTRTTELKALQDGPQFYRANIITNEDSVIPTVWSARNITRETEIPIRALPLGKRSTSTNSPRHCLIEFVDAAKHISKDDRIEVEGVYHAPRQSDLHKLNLGQTDFFGYTNSQRKSVGVAQLILVHPKRLGYATMSVEPHRSTRHDLQKITFTNNERSFAGEDAEVTGVFVNDLKMDETLFVNVSIVPS